MMADGHVVLCGQYSGAVLSVAIASIWCQHAAVHYVGMQTHQPPSYPHFPFTVGMVTKQGNPLTH